ncbi:MAG TPA: hypothetical protein VF228_06085 [Iamia sp.]
MVVPAGDDTFERGIEKARAALGGRPRPRPRSVPPPEPAPEPVIDDADERDARIAELEAEVRDLRAALARILDASRDALD